MSKKIFLPAVLALAILVVGIFAGSVNAQSPAYYPPIVQKIADKFNLSVSDVEKVFDEARDERRADMYAGFAERLEDLVSEGKLTESQKEAVLAKHEEMQDKMEEINKLPVEERKEMMKSLHAEFKKWAEDQGIDVPLLGRFGRGFARGFHKGYMMGSQN